MITIKIIYCLLMAIVGVYLISKVDEGNETSKDIAKMIIGTLLLIMSIVLITITIFTLK